MMQPPKVQETSPKVTFFLTNLKTTLPPLLIPSCFFHPQGTWRVGYINAHKYSTVLLCNKTNDILDIAIERMHLTPI